MILTCKDCVPEGGQTKEEEKKNEKFRNVTFASYEIRPASLSNGVHEF